jgi:hypothetical protein
LKRKKLICAGFIRFLAWRMRLCPRGEQNVQAIPARKIVQPDWMRRFSRNTRLLKQFTSSRIANALILIDSSAGKRPLIEIAAFGKEELIAKQHGAPHAEP